MNTSSRHLPLAILPLLFLACASLACTLTDQVVGLYRSEPTLPVASQAPDETTIPISPKDQALIDQAGEWDLFYEEKFADDGGSWLIGQDENEYLSVERSIAEGRYIWEATANQSTHAYVYPELEPVTDFSLSIELGLDKWYDGGLDGAAGIDFRMADDDNKYSFVISGEYYTFSRMSDGEWVTLIDWTGSPAIRPYRPNQVQVIARGSQFCFLINNQFVASYQDESIPVGQVALTIELYEPADRATFSFDNLVIRTP